MARVPTFHVSVFPAGGPAAQVSAVQSKPTGRVSVRTVFEAEFGPLFVTVRVQVTVPIGATTGESAVFVRERSASGSTVS